MRVANPPWALGRNAEVTAAVEMQNASLGSIFRVSGELRAGSMLEPESIAAIRRKAALDGCKWDIQVGDVTTLAPFPLVMKRSVWTRLAASAEQLASEAERAEVEIALRPKLLQQIGLPRPLRRILASHAPLTPAAGRLMRFDFHLTRNGWRISEANSDVPGGLTEASHFTSMMAEHFPFLKSAGDPGEAWCDALAKAAGKAGVIALLSAPGYMEDHQVNSFIAARLRERGCITHLAKPEQIHWRNSEAHLDTSWYCGRLDVIVRFYQSEWLARLPARMQWSYLIRGGQTAVTNSGLAAISESKRLPLAWQDLQTELPAWRALLPETADPRDVRWANDDSWLIKRAMCNTGDAVCIREFMHSREWRQTRFKVFLTPTKWVAQRRFDSVPVTTPIGKRHACVGIYTVNGRAAGAYARISEKPLIDFSATDIALLIENDD
jgi:hypothetical protein